MSDFTASTGDSVNKTTTQPAGMLLSKYGMIALAIFLILAAWANLTVIVILIGLFLSAAGLSKLWSHWSLKGVRCERQLTERRIFPGEYIDLKLRLENRKPLPLPWIEVCDEVPTGFIADLPASPALRSGYDLISRSTSILWYSAISWKYRLTCQKRGYYALGPLTVSSGDIFGFYPVTATESAEDHLIVYPKIYPLPQMDIPSLYPLGETRSEKRIFEDPSRIVGVRDYYPGDSLRRIHWKASARHQQLQVKVFESTTTLKVSMFLAMDSFRNSGSWKDEELELGISTVASLANYLIEKNSQVGLWVNTELADSRQPARILPGSGVGQLSEILEALAKVVSVASRPFAEYFQNERKELPLGVTLVFIISSLPTGMREILTDLRESGYKIVVFQIGEPAREEIPPDVTWHNIQQNGEGVGLA